MISCRRSSYVDVHSIAHRLSGGKFYTSVCRRPTVKMLTCTKSWRWYKPCPFTKLSTSLLLSPTSRAQSATDQLHELNALRRVYMNQRKNLTSTNLVHLVWEPRMTWRGGTTESTGMPGVGSFPSTFSSDSSTKKAKWWDYRHDFLVKENFPATNDQNIAQCKARYSENGKITAPTRYFILFYFCKEYSYVWLFYMNKQYFCPVSCCVFY